MGMVLEVSHLTIVTRPAGPRRPRCQFTASTSLLRALLRFVALKVRPLAHLYARYGF